MQVNRDITRPVVQYFGGKWQIAPWILSFMPTHNVYVELFGGGGSVLLRKPRSHAEVYNDLDSEVVNIFRMLQDRPNELVRALDLTPFSREEYYLACEPCDEGDMVEKARRAIVRAFFGFGSTGIFEGSRPGFRVGDKDSRVSNANMWRGYSDAVLAIVDRLRGVTIENLDALEVIPPWDREDTVFYADPPYLADLRKSKSVYTYEMAEAQHIALLETLCRLKGTVLVSGYGSDLYDRMLAGWERHEKKVLAQGTGNDLESRARVEVLWVKSAG